MKLAGHSRQLGLLSSRRVSRMLPHTMDESPTLNAIARLKLRELERQRDALVATYAAIEREAAAKTTRGALRALYRGLKRVRVADEPMHPDCVNLEGALAVGRGAARHFEAAAVAGAASGDLLFQAKMLLQQAKVAKRQGQLPQSKQLAQQVRVLCVDIGWEEGRVQAESL